MKSDLSSRERSHLLRAATQIVRGLSNAPKGFGLSVRPVDALRIRPAHSGGDWLRIGAIRGLGTCELWLDRYTGWERPQFWYGIGTQTTSLVQKAATLGQALLGEAVVRRVKDSDTHRPNDEYDRMKQRLPLREFDRPLLHMHGRNNNGFGVYSRNAAPLSDSQLDRLSARAVAFFIGLAMESSGASAEALDSVALPNRRHGPPSMGPWERHAKLMSSRKRRDDFTCSICRINFAILYGSLGRGYAQAHHIVSLGSESTLATSMSDLLTVCANCHAMLGRAPDGPDGVQLVRSAFTGRWPRSGRHLTTA